MNRKGSTAAQKNEGEGSKSAARRYDSAATAHAASGKSKARAEEAEKALDGPEAAEMKRAEEKGKAPLRGR